MKRLFNKIKEKYYNWKLNRIRNAILNTDMELLLILINGKTNIKVRLSNGMEGYIKNDYICQATNKSRSLKDCLKGSVKEGNRYIKVYFVKINNRLEVLLRGKSKTIQNNDVVYITDVLSFS